MKHFKFFLALVLSWMAGVAAYAELSHGDTFVKEYDDGSEVWFRVWGTDKVVVRGGKENAQGELTIPATVTYGSQTFDVVELDRGCFFNHPLLKWVTLPESITVIPVGAFNGTGVTDASILTILQHVKTIERYAFMNCTDLTFLTIPEGVELIDEGAFKDCGRLYSVDIPSTIKKIIGYPFVRPFAGCSSLTVATIRCPWLVGKDCRSASYNDHPIWCTFGNQIKDYYLKEPVTRIGAGAFRFCSNVMVVDCPPTLESIGVGAFERLCMKLVQLKTTVEKWCQVDFDDDEYLGYPMLTAVTDFMVPGADGEYVNVADHIVIPEGITEVKQYAFRSFRHLKEVTLPSTLESVGKMAFAGDVSLNKVTCLATTPPAIVADAFDDIPSDAILYVPTGCLDAYEASDWAQYFGLITELVEDAQTFTLGDMSYSIESVENRLVKLRAYNGSASKVEVPESIRFKNIDYTVVAIGDEAFKDRSAITELTLPRGISYIGSNAFSGCTGLTDLYLEAWAKPEVGDNAFGADLKDVCTLVVPSVTVANTLKNDEYWYISFKDIFGPSEPVPVYLDGWAVPLPFVILHKANTIQLGTGKNDTFSRYDDKLLAPSTFVLPETVVYEGTTYTVTRIAPYALNNNRITKVELPSSIEFIGQYAFHRTAINELVCPCDIPPSFDKRTYSNCVAFVPKDCLEAYNFWEAYFKGVVPDWTITVPTEEGVDMRFKVTGQDENGNYAVQTYGEYNNGVATPAIRSDYSGPITIPESFNVDGYTFVVTSIGEYSFSAEGNDLALTTVTIPATVETIWPHAFVANDSHTLSAIYFNGDLFPYYSGGDMASFIGTKNYTILYVTTTCMSNGFDHTLYPGTYFGDSNYQEMTFYAVNSDGVSICYGIKSINPNTVETYAHWNSHYGALTAGYPADIKIPSSVSDPESGKEYAVTGIGFSSFSFEGLSNDGCDKLISVSLPESITSIEESAFDGCSSLSQVICYAEEPPALDIEEWEGDVYSPFDDVSEDCALYVAYGCKDAYVNDADWVQYFGDRIYDKVPVTLSSYGIGTFCSNISLNFADVYGITPYVVTDFSGTTLTMKRQQEVPAGTGIVIYKGDGEDDFLFNSDLQEGETATGEQTFYVPVELMDAEIETNMLVGCPEATRIQPTDGDMTNFVLAKNPNDDTKLGFYKFETSNPDGRLIPAERAYLQIETSKVVLPDGIKGFSINIGEDDRPTSVESITTATSMSSETKIYNLAGQRLSKLQKGLNIVNGRKVIVK